MAAAAGLCPAGGQPPRRIGAAEFAAMIREELREHIDRKVGAAIDSSPQHGTEWAMLIGLRALTMLGGNSDNVPAPAVAAPPPPGVVAAAAAVGGPLEPLVDFVADSGDSVRARATARDRIPAATFGFRVSEVRVCATTGTQGMGLRKCCSKSEAADHRCRPAETYHLTVPRHTAAERRRPRRFGWSDRVAAG